jgi:hypothetical protein
MPNEYSFKVGDVLIIDDTSRPSGNFVRISLNREGNWVMEASFSRPEQQRKPRKMLQYSDTKERDRKREQEVETAMAAIQKK